jgi:hypothetical protein
MRKSPSLFIAIVLLVNALWLQRGGIGASSLIAADDITLRQATCEIISMCSLFCANILFSLWYNNKEAT